MQVDEMIRIIDVFRKQIPVDVDGLAVSLGIEVNYSNLDLSTSGMIEKKGENQYVISVNANHPRTRQRFTLAHELGHFLYHKDRMGNGIDDDKLYRSTDVGKYHNTRIGAVQETEANSFAVNLLMPFSSIKKLIEEGITESSDIAEKLDVSEHAIHIRKSNMVNANY